MVLIEIQPCPQYIETIISYFIYYFLWFVEKSSFEMALIIFAIFILVLCLIVIPLWKSRGKKIQVDTQSERRDDEMQKDLKAVYA